MSLTTNHCTFTPNTLTVDGITYPVEYSVTPTGNVFAFVPVCIDGQERKVRIHIAPDDPFHPAALAAAKEQIMMRLANMHSTICHLII